jgi:hypothetical protein
MAMKDNIALFTFIHFPQTTIMINLLEGERLEEISSVSCLGSGGQIPNTKQGCLVRQDWFGIKIKLTGTGQ